MGKFLSLSLERHSADTATVMLKSLRKSFRKALGGRGSKGNLSDQSATFVPDASSVATRSTERTKNEPTSNTNVTARTKNEIAVMKYLDSINRLSTEEIEKCFAPDAEIFFDDAQMIVSGYLSELSKVFCSFPDLTLSVLSLKEHDDGTVSAVLQYRGTHTGAPYGFGVYPELPAAGVAFETTPEHYQYTVQDDGRLKKKSTMSNGQLTGLAYVYTQLGGILF